MELFSIEDEEGRREGSGAEASRPLEEEKKAWIFNQSSLNVSSSLVLKCESNKITK